MVRSIVLTGIGGQGVVKTSEILGKAVLKNGFDVVVSEGKDAGIRGGSVNCVLKMGDQVSSPQIFPGRGDIVLGFEVLEGLRTVSKYLKEDGLFIINTREIPPYSVQNSSIEYPSLLENEHLLKDYCELEKINATEIAENLGNPKMGGIVMLGALFNLADWDLEKKNFRDAIKKSFPEEFAEKNLQAFETGFENFK